MKRREFITLLGGAAAFPFAARAQQPAKTARIGYFAFRSPIPADDAFLKGLAELGWIEGQNIVIERRFAGGNVEQLKGSAAELVRLNVDVIVAAASAPTKVANFCKCRRSRRPRFCPEPSTSRWKHHRDRFRCKPGHYRQTSAAAH